MNKEEILEILIENGFKLNEPDGYSLSLYDKVPALSLHVFLKKEGLTLTLTKHYELGSWSLDKFFWYDFVTN